MQGTEKAEEVPAATAVEGGGEVGDGRRAGLGLPGFTEPEEQRRGSGCHRTTLETPHAGGAESIPLQVTTAHCPRRENRPQVTQATDTPAGGTA